MHGSVTLTEQAVPFMLARAREIGLTLDGRELRSVSDLWEVGVFRRLKSNVYRYANGHCPITRVHAEHICTRLKLTPEMWQQITVPADSPPRGAATALQVDFLGRLVANGLESVVAFAPRQEGPRELVNFCVPARVITEEEWSSVLGSGGRSQANLTETMETLLVRRSSGVWLNGWLRRPHRRVVLKGEPGEGKTTALWLYLAELCRTGVEHLSGNKRPGSSAVWRMPLALPLGAIRPDVTHSGSLAEFAVDFMLELVRMSAADVSVIRDWLHSMIEERRFVLLLDALDEMPPGSAAWLRNQLAELPDVPVVLTTRYHGDPYSVLRQFKVLRMVSLPWWVIDDFVGRFFAPHPNGTRLANDIRRTFRQKPKLRRLAQNPLLLGVLCHLKSDDESAALPASGAGLLQAALRSMLERGDQKRNIQSPRQLRDETKIAVLAAVAWRFQERGPCPIEELELLSLLDRERTSISEDPPRTAEALLKEFLQDGVLVRRGHGPYEFMLRRFREYALAWRLERLARQHGESPGAFARLVRGRSEGWGRGGDWTDFRPLNQPGWSEVWPLVAGIGGGGKAVLQAVIAEWESAEDLVSSRLRLLVAALGEFLDARAGRGTTVKEWEPLTKRLAAAVLDLAANELPITGLLHSWRASLTQLPPEVVLEELARRLSSGSVKGRSRDSYVIALGEIGTSAAREHLRVIIGDKDAEEGLRANSAVALGLVGDATSRDTLLLWLGRSQKKKALQTLHFGCISGLSYVADALSRTALANLLETSQDASARWQCIQECERLFGPEIEGAILGVLEQSAAGKMKSHQSAEDIDGTLQKSADILGRIGSPASAKRMLELLQQPLSPHVKRRLCAAAADSGDSQDREAIRSLVIKPGPDPQVSNFAATALIRVGDEELLPKLLEATSDPRCPESLRLAAVESCQECSSPLASRFLLDRLVADPSPKVQVAAARAVAGHDRETVAEPLRRGMKSNMPDAVRFECAFALAGSGDVEAEKWLASALVNRENQAPTRVLATRGLGRSGGETAREVLHRVATDPRELPPIRAHCVDALQEIQQQHGWRPLKNGGWDMP